MDCSQNGRSHLILVEACVTSLEESIEAENAGAGRLELCRDLQTGGLTPSLDLFHEISQRIGIPVNVMIRPHPGDYTAVEQNFDEMRAQIACFKAAGASGLVLGILDSSNRIDVGKLAYLVEASEGLPVTFHRAFDLVRDKVAAALVLIETGISRLLTGGGEGTAWDGRSTIDRLVRTYGDTLEVMAGGSVRADNVMNLIAETGVRELHARASAVRKIVETLKKSAL
jgi:copper homeostasis protein